MKNLPRDYWILDDYPSAHERRYEDMVQVNLTLKPDVTNSNRKKPCVASVRMTKVEAESLYSKLGKILMDMKAEVEIGPAVETYRKQQQQELEDNVKAYEKKLRKDRGLLTEDEKEEAERKEALDLLEASDNRIVDLDSM